MKHVLAILGVIILAILLSGGAPFYPPDWLTERFDAHWVIHLDPGDVLFYFDDSRDLRNIRFDGTVPTGDCVYGLDDRSAGVARLFGNPENEVLPWLFCDTRNERLIVWSSPNYHLPNRDPSIKRCEDPDIDSDEQQIQDGCQVDWDDDLGHYKEIIEAVR